MADLEKVRYPSMTHTHTQCFWKIFTVHIFRDFLLSLQAEFQTDIFGPVSRFLTKRCPDQKFGEICNKMKYKSKHMAGFYLHEFIWSWTLS